MDDINPKEMDYCANRKRFIRLLKLPMICLLGILALFFIWGIVDPVVFIHKYNAYSDKAYYGVMRLPNKFLCWFIWQMIGAFFGVLAYFFLKMALSYQALVIINLEKLSGIIDVKSEQELNSISEQSNSNQFDEHVDE